MKCPKCGKKIKVGYLDTLIFSCNHELGVLFEEIERYKDDRKFLIKREFQNYKSQQIEIDRLKPFEEMVKNMLIYFDTNKEEIKAAGMTNYEVVKLIKKLRVNT